VTEGLHWLAVAAWLLLSFFLSGMEAGVQSLSRLRIRQWVRAGRPGAQTLLGYLERPENFLWTILLGNTLANFAAVALLVADLHQRLAARPVWFWTAFTGAGVLLYVFCDLLPKTLFRRMPNRLCLGLVWPFRLVHAALAPFVAVIERFAGLLLRWTRGTAYTGRLFGNREELRALMQETAPDLSSTERALINRVLDLQHVTLGRLARPLETAVTVTADTPLPQVIALCREHGVTRLPVWRGAGGQRRVAGYVSLKDLLHGERPAGPAGRSLRPALFLDESLRVDAALRRLQRTGEQFAVVVGPDGRERGLITLWDLLRALFGETPH
jgi:putative hemolysin